MTTRKSVLLIVLLFLIWGIQGMEVLGQSKYPSKPIELIITFPPGGQTDLATRILAEWLKNKLGQPVLVINKPGGSGMLGASTLAKSSPDGYTIASMGDSQAIINFFLLKSVPYKLSDFRIIAQWAFHGSVIVVPGDSQWKTMKEFIQYAKANPGIRYADQGKGSSVWMQMQYLFKEAKLVMEEVPFNGDMEILSAVSGKHIPMGILGYVTAKPQQDAGKLRMLMTFVPWGIEGEPSLPTIKDVLEKEVSLDAPLMAIFVPAKTPDYVVEILSKAFKETISDPAFRSKMKEIGLGVKYMDEKQLAARNKLQAEVIKNILAEAKLIKE
jgi:tripartite-type tricarboxylate transporter receptor subunit TctC